MEKLKCPEVRFNGHSESWSQQPLNNIFGKIRNAFVGTATPFYVKKGNFYLESNNVKNGKINKNTQIFIDDYFYFKQRDKWLKTNDIVMVQSGHVGHSAVISEELNNSAAHALIMFSDYKVQTDPHFLNYQWQTNSTKNAIEKIATGNTIRHILSSDMKEFLSFFSSYDEQTQIGNFFQNLDQSITLQEKKLTQTQNLKNAMLEKMLPNAVNKQPEIRLKGFSGEWEQVELDKVFSFLRGEAFSKNDISDKGNFRCIHYGELFTRYGAVIEEISSKTNLRAENLGKKGDVLMPSSDVTPDGLAKASSLQVDDVYLGGDINILRPKKECCSNFFSYLINHQKFKILLCVTGTTVKHVYNKDLKGLAYMIPKLDEQIEIGRLFKQFDETIVLQQQQLRTLKNLKQGFLEKMFV